MTHTQKGFGMTAPSILHPRIDDLARALREQAPPKEIVRIVRGVEPTREPVPFRIVSDAVQTRGLDSITLGLQYADRPIIYGTHSASNTQDMHGTWWSVPALESMRQSAADRLTIWRNHEYRVPQDILGTAVDAALVERVDPVTGQHTDLDIATLVVSEAVNKEAMQSYAAIKEGVKLGQSVGCFILDWSWTDPDGNRLADVEEDMCGPLPYDGDVADARLTINDVLLVESSLVGIPSNRRSWVRDAERALRRAGVLPPVRAERVVRTRAHFLGVSVGEVSKEMAERGHRAGATYLSGRDYTALPDADRDRMARFVIHVAKEGIDLPEPDGVLPEVAIRDQSQRITRIADDGCRHAPHLQRSADVAQRETAAPAADDAHALTADPCDCGCTCAPGAPDANCDCTCVACASARTGDAEIANLAATAAGSNPLESAGTDALDLTLAALDADLNAALGVTVVTTPPVAVTTTAPADTRGKKAKKDKQAPNDPVAVVATNPADTSAAADFAAKMVAAQDLYERTVANIAVLSQREKQLRKETKRAAKALERADATGLYRPTRQTSLRPGVLDGYALIDMTDDEIIAALPDGDA